MIGSVLEASWFYWAVGIAIGLPLALIGLTEWQHTLRRRGSSLIGPVTLLRNFLLPLGALLLAMIGATQMPAGSTPVRIVGTLVAIVVLILMLSGIKASLFASAPRSSWRRRVPAIFLDVIRFALIAVGVGLIFAYIWGANVGGLFTALGISSIVLGLTLQNSVGQIISGLLLLFEQPFQIGDWVETSSARGRVVEVNWRATHINTGSGLETDAIIERVGRETSLGLKHFGSSEQLLLFTEGGVYYVPEQVAAPLSPTNFELLKIGPEAAGDPVPLDGYGVHCRGGGHRCERRDRDVLGGGVDHG
jgi:hypothetical protein